MLQVAATSAMNVSLYPNFIAHNENCYRGTSSDTTAKSIAYANRKIGVRADLFIQAIDRTFSPVIDKSVTDLRALDIMLRMIMKDKNHTIKKQLTKTEGFFNRFFSGESWPEWLENRTALGRVVSLYTNFAGSNESLDVFMARMTPHLIDAATKEAEQFLSGQRRQRSELPVFSEPQFGLVSRIGSVLARVDAAFSLPVAAAAPANFKDLFREIERVNEKLKDISKDMIERIIQEQNGGKNEEDSELKDLVKKIKGIIDTFKSPSDFYEALVQSDLEDAAIKKIGEIAHVYKKYELDGLRTYWSIKRKDDIASGKRLIENWRNGIRMGEDELVTIENTIQGLENLVKESLQDFSVSEVDEKYKELEELLARSRARKEDAEAYLTKSGRLLTEDEINRLNPTARSNYRDAQNKLAQAEKDIHFYENSVLPIAKQKKQHASQERLDYANKIVELHTRNQKARMDLLEAIPKIRRNIEAMEAYIEQLLTKDEL